MPRIRWFRIFQFFAVPIGVLIGVLMVVGFLLGVGWTIRESLGRSAMQAELQKLEDEGIPTDSQAISDRYQMGTSVDSAEEWDSLFSELRSPEFTARATGVPDLDQRVEEDENEEHLATSTDWIFLDVCDRFTQEHHELISRARKLANEEDPVYFPIHFQATATLLSEVQDVRQVAYLLYVDARVALCQRDKNRVFENMIALIELSKHPDAVPIDISRIVGVAIRLRGLKILQSAIRIDLLDDAQLQEIDQLLGRYTDVGDRWKTWIVDEMSLYLPEFRDPGMVMKTEKYLPARGHDAVFYIELMRKGIAIPSDDWPGLYRAAKELERELVRKAGLLSSVDHILTNLLAPAFSAYASILINDAQLHRQGRIAVSLRRFTHQHNRLPATLAELPDDIQSLRPYGDVPFQYQTDSSGAVLWGVWVTDKHQMVSEQLPGTQSTDADFQANRNVVWRLDSP